MPKLHLWQLNVSIFWSIRILRYNVRSETNLKNFYSKKRIYFPSFFYISAVYTSLAKLKPPPEGSGGLVVRNGLDDPFLLLLLEALLVKGEASQILLYSPEERKIRHRQIPQVGRVQKQLEAVVSKPLLHSGGNVNRRVVQ